MARIPAAERRNDLVNAAIQVIATHGVDGATTRRIAEQADAPLATLHYCFASKELLFAAVFERVAAQYQEVIIRSDVHGDVATTARELLRGVMLWYLESKAFGAATIELVSWAQRQEGNPAAIVYNQAFAVLRSILGKANGDGALPPETIEEISYIVASLADGFALNWLTFGDRAEAARQVDLSISVLDAWLATKLGSRAPAVQWTPTPAVQPRTGMSSLVSWVDVD
ncbi:TetR/AcrR family transcriptional regulator [Nocardia africana]|uniref:Putative DNA-binding transcriptional regulator n=1 Tax=Nocardia africana TaxID=134964 RepID=A0A378X453_9NOCA|nr:TetR/AcrR family transcriptional regulator [Nocardia africana]MCC3316814.1 TetR/AcrR family transcriptional regulator [Nocardia africana]SUA47534.1 putative DNA-binding transcriptional regulator [Nocardia africana]